MPSGNLGTISEMEIRDEFASLDAKAKFNRVARVLSNKLVKTVLVVDGDEKEVVGVISEQLFLQACATGIDPLIAECHEHMSTKILRLLENTPQHSALKLIKSKSPDAVIILTDERKFKGYLSPSDYRQLEPITESQIVANLDEEESTADEQNEQMTDFFSTELGSGNIGPVIWYEDGAELVIHNESIQVDIHDNNMALTIQVSCDQAPSSTITMNFDLGTGESLDLKLVAEESPSGNSLVIGRWAPVLQQTIYEILLKYINGLSSNSDGDLKGFYGDNSGLKIAYEDSRKAHIKEVSSR